jgi:histidyl-tRNA synthetase
VTRPSAPRGLPDVVPPASEYLEEAESIARILFDRYGYRRIEPPVMEYTEVFQRAAGDTSEVVLDKQMYTFTDRSDRSLTLRPEGTAGIVRAFIENDLGKKLPLPVRLFTIGPMFRYERPQKGRDRQFEQIDAECIGSASPLVDAELILLAWEFYRGVGLDPELNLNSMGDPADRERYWPVLRSALGDKIEDMCEDCHVRLKTNPLRIFDCKQEGCRAILRGGDIPPITEFLGEDSKAHYAAVQEALENLGIAWKDAPHLVRGFDYYTRTVFEFDLPTLGGRPTIGAGGRYDGLVEQLGGPSTPACGFAIGVTPTLVALQEKQEAEAWKPELFIAWMEGLGSLALAAATELRRTNARVTVSDDSRSMKSQFRQAERLGARLVLILGRDEVSRRMAKVKNMETGNEREVSLDDLVKELLPDA